MSAISFSSVGQNYRQYLDDFNITQLAPQTAVTTGAAGMTGNVEMTNQSNSTKRNHPFDADEIAMHPIFIVGAPRSGTSWVQRLLLSDPAICGGQETHFFNVFGEVPRSFQRHRKLGRNVGLPCYWEEQALLDEIRALWRRTVAPVIADRPEAQFLIEKTPDHATAIPEIFRLLPQAKVIHVIRDSRSVVASLLAAGKDWGSAWAPKSAHDAAVLWNRYTRHGVIAGENLRPDQYLMVRYEDLMRDGVPQLRRLFDFIGIDKPTWSLEEAIAAQQFSQQKNCESPIPVVRGSSVEPTGFFRKGQVDSWRQDLSLVQKLIVWRYTRKLMRQLGYNWNGRDRGQA